MRFPCWLVAAAALCCVSCSNEPAAQTPPAPTPVTLGQAIAQAVARNAPDLIGPAYQANVAYYQQQPWNRVDLNGDGQDEVMAAVMYAVTADGEKWYLPGATGNGPLFILAKDASGWRCIADVSGSGCDIQNEFVNGWPVIHCSWRMSLDDYPTYRMEYHDGQYIKVGEPWNSAPAEDSN